MLKADFHSHTNYLQKGETNYSPKELIDRAAELKFDVFCISEHYVLTKLGELLPEYRKYPFASYGLIKDYAKEKGILLLRSVEIKYPEGEVLLVNFQGNVKDYPTLKSLEKLPSSVLVIAPHPYFKRSICLGENLEKNIGLFGAVEYAHMYSSFINLNKKAAAVAARHKKPMVGTSDAHHLLEVGITYTLVDSKKNAGSIVNAVRAGRIKLVTRPMPAHLFAFIALSNIFKICAGGIRIMYRLLSGK
ncbi:MAG TPA: PHP domain-containing protein [Nanoarchaeota archaeon]|nr:PHP domain-containing protein [Nanoarchaeota archaeon]